MHARVAGQHTQCRAAWEAHPSERFATDPAPTQLPTAQLSVSLASKIPWTVSHIHIAGANPAKASRVASIRPTPSHCSKRPACQAAGCPYFASNSCSALTLQVRVSLL